MARSTAFSLAALAAAAAAAAAPPSWPTTEPHWPHYASRAVQVLSGQWDFGFQQAGDAASLPYSAIVTPNTTTVPGSFDVAPPGVLGPRGVAFFRTTMSCTPKSSALLRFMAVNFYARVFVDGAEVGNHTAGGYVPFQMVSPPCGAGGVRELALITSNTQNRTLSPTFTGGDFYFFSGIIRPVIVTELPTAAPVWIDRIEPFSRDVATLTIDVRVVLGGDVASLNGRVGLSLAFNGAALPPSPTSYTLATTGPSSAEAYIAGVRLPAGSLPWSTSSPNLYTLLVSESTSGDAVEVRSGLRVLGVDAATSRVTINGEVVKLLGFNRHTLWPDTGASVTPAQEQADLMLLRGLNSNYVRGAHYPQSQSWLDLLDESGIVLWEETLGPGTSTADMNDPYFMSNHIEAVNSMVGTSFAHPSVIFHAFFNEGPSDDPKACVGYQASSAAIKARVVPPASAGGGPPMRYVTWANNHGTSDVCTELAADVASFNSYPGWYDREGNVTYPAVYWAEQVAWVEANWPALPLMVSETGGGGVYEWHNDTAPFPGPQWSQYFQTNLVSADARFIASNDRISGLTLWQFSDIKANDQSTAQCGQCDYLPHPNNLSVPWDCAYINVSCGRPGGENHKGAVDMWRRVKEEYAVLSLIYKNASGAGP